MRMTIKVLLVDDEAVDLEWLKRRIVGSGLDIRVTGTANSGFQALSILEEEQADIIVSDIRMPIMTGIEFARKAKTIHPDIKILFISGHEDFGYAKEAIAIHASGYLLKPVEDQELYQALASLCGQVEREREQSRSFSETLSLVNEQLLLRWFEDATPSRAETHIRSLLEPLLRNGSAAALVEIDDLDWKLRDLPEEARRQQTAQIAQQVRTVLSNAKLGMLIGAHANRFAMLTAVPEGRHVGLLEELAHEVRRSAGYTVTIGVGPYATEEAGLHASYRQAQAALSAKWLLGKNRLIQGETVIAAPDGPIAGIDRAVDRMLEAIAEYDLVAIDDCLLDLFNKEMPVARKQEVYERIIRITSKLHADLQQRNENLYELLEWESHQPDVLFRFETMHDVLSWLRRRFFELSELLYAKKQRQKRKRIEAVMQYVEENLEKKLTLKEVAASFDFTPNYLGHLFKEEAGVLFSDYLNDRKTARVCELLRDPALKIYEIADRMGYKNIIYFNRQFKQATGMSPGEYRKKNRI
jgi:two-component system, response regulator YesN